MKRIVLHWTGGAGKPNAHEKECYHFLVTSSGDIVNGNYKPEDNLDCTDKRYAQHTGGGNTGSIGVALCGMLNFTMDKKKTLYPLTKKQCEAAFKLVADLCKKYKILITPTTVLTHYEFGQAHKSTTSFGKPDITYLFPYPDVKTANIGNFIRQKVKWYYTH